MWVTAKSCTSCTTGTPSFNNNASSTFQAGQDSTGAPVPVTITYGSGAVGGDLVRDTVAMGGFQVQRQPWLLVDQTSSDLLDGTNAGIMGLAYDTIANTGATPFWQTLASTNQFTTPEMSFWINRESNNPTAPKETFGGYFTLGGQNQSLYQGTVEFLPLVTNVGKPTYWLLNVSGTHGNLPRLCSTFFSPTCLDYNSGHCEREERQLAIWRKCCCHRHRYDTHRRPFRRCCGHLRSDSRFPATLR